MPSQRILYVGADHALLASLKNALKGCQVVRSPGGVARVLIESKINYSLLIFDGDLTELADSARSLPHRQQTPVLVLTAEGAVYAEILTTVQSLLAGARRGYNFDD